MTSSDMPQKPGDPGAPDDHVPYAPGLQPPEGPTAAATAFYERLQTRRSIRAFSDRPVAVETIRSLVRCATTAPSGANKQPWRFVAVSNPDVKRRIREAAEEEERTFYEERASDRWLDALRPLGTAAEKPFIETAPWLVVVFRLTQGDDGSQIYYPMESVGLAVGMFLAAAHLAGLGTLTHTPSPMKFLGKILDRPDHERPFLLIPVGYPAEDCTVPRIASERKALSEVCIEMT